MALLTPDLLQRPEGTLSALSFSAGSHFSQQNKSCPLPSLTNAALTSNRLMGAGFGEAVVPVNLRQIINPKGNPDCFNTTGKAGASGSTFAQKLDVQTLSRTHEMPKCNYSQRGNAGQDPSIQCFLSFQQLAPVHSAFISKRCFLTNGAANHKRENQGRLFFALKKKKKKSSPTREFAQWSKLPSCSFVCTVCTELHSYRSGGNRAKPSCHNQQH